MLWEEIKRGRREGERDRDVERDREMYGVGGRGKNDKESFFMDFFCVFMVFLYMFIF